MDEDKIKVSIITICKNSEDYIEKTILSVINQSYSNIEYIIVDGASEDKTIEIVNKYKDRISIVVSEPDKGISDAFNKGIMKSSGELIGIVNSDDILFDNNVISKLIDEYEDSVDVYQGTEIVKNYKTGYEYHLFPTMSYGFWIDPVRFHPCHMATYIKRETYKKYGLYDLSYYQCMDIELLYRLHYKGAVFKQINVIFGVFRTGGKSYSDDDENSNEKIRIVSKYSGNKIDSIICSYVCFLKNVLKHISARSFGEDFARKIRYKRW